MTCKTVSSRLPSVPRRLVAIMLSATALASAAAVAQSLYDESTFRPLTADNKAFRVGDVITIQVFENSAASANADTGTRRSNNLSTELTRAHIPSLSNSVGVAGQFDGGGHTARAGKLLAQLTVSVHEVMPNGDLRIGGEQLLLINQEQQRINLEGRVRPQDVSDTNVVLSSRLADARITYVGEGDLAQRQKPAWWRKTLDWLGL
jgi:flagellar L-ring protein precursor FlgH